MLPEPFDKALVLTGPTGSGKTALALDWAKRYDAEIICMDSMTLYRGMDIGTAKATIEQRREVRHHLLDVLDPWQPSSVAWWLQQANACCREIESRGKCVLFVGGTALYLKALLHGLFEGPPADEAIRQELVREAAETGSETLHKRLAKIDPVTAERLHSNDIRRIIRALEVYQLTGQPISAWQRQWPNKQTNQQRTTNQVFYLDVPRPELYARIDLRVIEMFKQGLIEEVKTLLKLPYPLGKEARQALGYKEILDHFEGKLNLEETIERIQTRSRQFAKRQMTWFRNMPEVRPLGSGQVMMGRMGPI
jgi:tRNA dimethylallyltransferase